MIQLQSISLLRGPRQLLADTSLRVHPNEKVGLVGANGCGKSSLFELLLDKIHADTGSCQLPKHWRISHMVQEITDVNRSALDFVIDGNRELRSVQQSIDSHRGDESVLANLYQRYEELDGYSAEASAARLLDGLGFQNDEFGKAVNHFSGGWRVRLALAQALMCPSDLLLLDEPTNHLDLGATLWLERWLRNYSGTLIIVSHDRDFLDEVINTTVHIEYGKLNRYSGNYSKFELQRAERLAQQQAQFVKQQERITEINNFVRRFRAKASKAKQAQSRLKELERMEQIAPAHVDSPFHFTIPCNDKVPQTLVTLQQARLGYGQQTILNNININLSGNARIGLLGKNGAGKSTLLKSIAGDQTLLGGERHENDGLRIGYFAQHQLQSLDLTASPAIHIQRLSPNVREQEIRLFLGGFDFQGDRVFEPITNFSGGEKARLTLAMIAWCKPNLLILDEPTNHLDLDMRHALTIALQDFQGAVIVVSHDRHLLRNTVDELWMVANSQLLSYEGDLDEYQRWLLDSSDSQTTETMTEANDIGNKKQQRQAAAQQRAALKPLADKIKRLEKELEKLQDQLNGVTEQLSDNCIYDDNNKEKLRKLLLEQSQLKSKMTANEESWLQAQEEFERHQL
jgi:ATP-binding cassette subfamily F protein 3